MLSKVEVESWLSQFDAGTQQTLNYLSDIEDWTLDQDADVQAAFTELHHLLEQSSEELGIDGVNWLSNIPLEDLVKLQGQVSYKSAVKLFGDVCYLDADKAQSMLIQHSLDTNAQDAILKISSLTLSRRILILIRLKLIQRIFSEERHQQVINAIQSQFDEK